jgi:hypothetical protein
MVGMFLKFGNQILFRLFRMEQCATTQLTDKDTTGGMFDIVACMNTDTLETGYVIEQG